MKKLVVVLVLLSVFACSKDEENSPPSDRNELIDFIIEESAGFTPVKTYIDSINGFVHVFNAFDFKASDFPITLSPELVVSEGASVVPASGASVTFNSIEDFVLYTITSSDGTNSIEYIFSLRDGQIPNAEFENWYIETGMNSLPFQEPGKYKESTVWATANMGTSIYSIYGTSPVNFDGNTAVKVETVTTLALPLVAGALYVGKFNLDGAISDPTNPVAAADLGMPFIAKPKAVKFKYSYQPGDQMIQAVLKDPGNLFGGFDIFNLEGRDKFGIKAVLERRVGENVTLIAQSAFESNEKVEMLSDFTLDLEYLSAEEPTHFYISFSPSFDGGTFIGAVGSTLIIDDIELIYE